MPGIDLTSLPVATWLAMWGALTGTVAWGIGIYNFLVDRPRLKIRMSSFEEDRARQIDPNIVLGGDSQYFLVEVLNAGRRKATIYHPEMWFVNQLGLLEYCSPSMVLRDELWSRVEDHWKLFALTESDTVSFIFSLRQEQRFVRVDVADTVRRFTHRRSLRGVLRWWRAKLKPSKTWPKLRDEFFDECRPRHHKKD